MLGKPPPGKPFDICERREARESRTFLRITHDRWSNFVRVEGDIREITEIRNILSAMIRRIDEAS